MLSVIKTAIITIIISFISGVLLDSYKNLAPRIICILGKGESKKVNNKNYREYSLVVKNLSKKTLHDLNINVQDKDERILVKDSKITKGLRFDFNKELNDYNIAIPFLSKNDEFTAKIVVEETTKDDNRPFIALRSPEKFKKIYKESKSNKIHTLNSELESCSNEEGAMKKAPRSARKKSKNKGFSLNKKSIAAVIGMLIVAYIAVLGVEHISKDSVDSNASKSTSSTQSKVDDSNSSSKTLESNNNSTNNNKDTDKKSSGKSSSNSSSAKNSESVSGGNNTETKTGKESQKDGISKQAENVKTNSTDKNEKSTSTEKDDTSLVEKPNPSTEVNQSKNNEDSSKQTNESKNSEKSTSQNNTNQNSTEKK